MASVKEVQRVSPPSLKASVEPAEETCEPGLKKFVFASSYAQMSSINNSHGKRTTCRCCGAPLTRTVVDLGAQPPCNSVVSPERFNTAEAIYPLHAKVCSECLLVQLDTDISPDSIYTEYSY